MKKIHAVVLAYVLALHFFHMSVWVIEILEVNLTFNSSFAVQVRDAARRTVFLNHCFNLNFKLCGYVSVGLEFN